MTDSPKVVFNYEFELAINNPDRRRTNTKKILKRTTTMFDYYSNIEKRAMSLLDYYTGKINKTDTMNLVLEDGSYATKKQIEKRKNEYLKYIQNSNLSKCVVSFNNDYINANIDIHKLEKLLVREVIPMYLKKCGYKDINKMSYQLSLHTDTDNLHFHFSYIEKEPNFIYAGGKLGYKRNGVITESQINFLKNEIQHVIEKEKIYTPLLIETNKEINELKKYFKPNEKNFLLKDKKDLLLENKVLELGKLLYDSRNGKNEKIKFNSIRDKQIRELTFEIKRYIFSKNNPEFNKEYDNFKISLGKINDYFQQVAKDNRIKNIKENTTLIDGKTKYLDNYIYNAVVNYSHKYYGYKKKTKLTENDIVKEIVYCDYLKHKKQTRYDILKSYVSNSNKRFENKKNIERAIHNIDYELNQASKEFSKMFNNKDLDYHY